MAKARYRAGSLFWSASLLDDARASFDDALGLFEAAGDRIGVVLSRTDLGVVALNQGDCDAAIGLARADCARNAGRNPRHSSCEPKNVGSCPSAMTSAVELALPVL